jgi:hypothetical protein
MDINQYYGLRTNQYGNNKHCVPTQLLPSIYENSYYNNRNYNHMISVNKNNIVIPATHNGYNIKYQPQKPQKPQQQQNLISLRNSTKFKSMQNINVYIDHHNQYYNTPKPIIDSDEDLTYSPLSPSSTKSYSSSSSSTQENDDDDSFISLSIKRHNLHQLNENFKKLLSKPYNYYLNDSVFKCIRVKTSSYLNNDENDVTLNDVNDDSISDTSSEYFSRYAPTDDEND